MVALRFLPAFAALAALVFLPLAGMPGPGLPDLPPQYGWLGRPGAAALLWLIDAADPSPWVPPALALALHACNSALFAALLGRLFPSRALWLASLFYAVHPLQTESLAVARLAAALPGVAFTLAAMHAHLGGQKRRALAWGALAVLFEPATAIIPLVFWTLARGTPARKPLLRLSAAGGMLWIAALAASQARAVAEWPWFGIFALRALFQFFFPLGLAPAPDLHAAPWQAALAALAVAAVAWLALTAGRRAPAGAWLLAAIALLASVYFLPAAPSQPLMALPLLALTAVAALMLEQADIRLAGVYAAVLAALAFSGARQWRDPASLWMDAVRLAPDSVAPRLALAPRLPPAQALELLLEAQARHPSDPAIAVATGSAFLRAQRPHEAMAEFDRALSLAPRDHQALAGRAAAWLALHRADAALGDLRLALKIEPCSLEARIALARLGETPPEAPCPFTRAQRRALEAATSGR